MNRFWGIIIVVLALGIMIVPAFTDCQSQGRALALANGNSAPMKCHWTGIAEIAVGVPLLAVGGIMAIFRWRGNILAPGIIGGILGILAVLLPHLLIGVCQMPTMICRTTMLPVLTVLGSLAVFSNAAAVAFSLKKERSLIYATGKPGIQEY